jgi:NodT family efflux transporter outer membrane factor (OMF) lipoprotein
VAVKRNFALVFLVLFGCKPVGPDYQLPQQALVNAPAAQSHFAGAGSAATADTEPPDRWWRMYSDPELNRLVENALAANTDLRVAEANLERSRALVAQAKAGREVQGSFNFAPSYAQLSAEQYLQQQIISPTGLYDLGVSVSYELDLFGGIRRGIEAASAEDEAVEAARDLVRMTVAAQVSAAYVDLCSAGAQLKTVQRLVALQKDRLGYLQKLVAAGRGTRLDITRAQGLLAQTLADVPGLEARQRDALFLLATLAGRPPAAFDASLGSCQSIPPLTRPIPVGDGAALLKRRPDIRRSERELAAATARIGVVTADLYPSITLGGSLGSTGLLTDIFDPLTNRFAIGPAIHWDLNQTATRARIAEAEAASRAALAQFDGVVLKALRETESALNIYTKALERDVSIRAARDNAAQALADAQTLEVAGRATSLETLDAERTLVADESAVTASQAQIAADQVAVFLALGGGWQKNEPDPQAPQSGR